MTERWRTIPKFLGYAVSSLGRVKSFYSRPGYRRRQPKIMTILVNPVTGQRYIRLRRNKAPVLCYVSRLMLSAFIRTPRKGEEAAHLNGNNQDDRLQNLIWATHQVNQSHRRWHGTSCANESNPNAKLSLADVKAIRHGMPHIDGNTVARLFNISKAQVSRIRTKQTLADDHTNMKKQIAEKTFQQGDLLGRKLESLPEGKTKIIGRKTLVLAHGESGHSRIPAQRQQGSTSGQSTIQPSASRASSVG